MLQKSRLFLSVSVVANLILLVVCFVLVYWLIQHRHHESLIIDNNQAIVEVVQAFDSSEVVGDQVEIGPWGPPVEEMKKHRKW
ncbi:MAG: hypothetical protein N2558_02800 [Patescibacteria group bacterium]|nr:hypothetical protein [Patescibacteria group bacterium]